MRRWCAPAVVAALGLVLVIACSGADETAPPPTATAAPGDRCSEPTDADCIRAVYGGAPGDYAQVADIPAAVLLAPDAEGRYDVERGRQVTVVTAATLPTGYTRFPLQRSPPRDPASTSFEQLVPPARTTYTFAVTEDESAPTLVTFDLTAAKPAQGPGLTPELGDVAVTTTFRVVSCGSGIAVPDPTTNDELVGECERLLAMRDTLAGIGTLNWSATRALASWTGLTVMGTPGRVTKLELSNSGMTGELTGLLGTLTALTELRLDGNALTGTVPSKVAKLTRLTDAYLAGNDLTGCVPPSLRAVANNDVPSLSLLDCDAPAGVVGKFASGDLLPPGTYLFQVSSRDTPIVFDIPSGSRIELGGIAIASGGASFGYLRDETTGSQLCLSSDGVRAFECGRSAGPGSATGQSVAMIFDRIAESLWLAD